MIVPLRSRLLFTSATLHSKRSPNSMLDISKLTNSVAAFSFIAVCSAMFIAKAVLPILGRAARMISSEPCRPPVRSS